MITVYEFQVNFHVACERRSSDIEGRLAKVDGESNKFEAAIEVVEFSPKGGGTVFTSDKTHHHSEEFSVDTCEEAMDVFTRLLNTFAMPLISWADDEDLVETKRDESPIGILETKPDVEE